eukprot:SAG31_NODE_27521_length_424_cov_3.243077_1_plen_21_part_01
MLVSELKLVRAQAPVSALTCS